MELTLKCQHPLLGLTSHSDKEKLCEHFSKYCVYHFAVCQRWDNGHKVSTIGKELHLSAVQSSKCVVLNKLALEG